MPFWTPALDPANPLAGSHPERYVLRRLDKEGDAPKGEGDASKEESDALNEEGDAPVTETYLGLDPNDQSVLDVHRVAEAHHFLTHEAALRAAGELNRLGRGPLDVVKVGDL
jgi:hypothetical protein